MSLAFLPHTVLFMWRIGPYPALLYVWTGQTLRYMAALSHLVWPSASGWNVGFGPDKRLQRARTCKWEMYVRYIWLACGPLDVLWLQLLSAQTDMGSDQGLLTSSSATSRGAQANTPGIRHAVLVAFLHRISRAMWVHKFMYLVSRVGYF